MSARCATTNDAAVGQGPVEQPARWPDERLTLAVLDVAGLLADEHEARCSRAFAEHGGARVPVQIASGAARGLGGQFR